MASAHTLTERYQAPLPLLAYVGGAAIAVAMSFAFVALRAPRDSAEVAEDGARHPIALPGWLGVVLRSIGLVAWLWIVAQALAGGNSLADVSSLFLWVYGWVGLAIVSAFIGPLWSWIDPFSTIHALLGRAGRLVGFGDGEPAEYPARLGIWPAVVGFAAVIWLELVAQLEGGRTLGLVLVGYTILAVAAMSYFGRDEWRRRGEIFSVWFGLLGRLAPLALDGRPEDGRLRRQPFGTGLRGEWTTAEVTLVTLGTGAIILDGLVQTRLYFDLFVRGGFLGLPETLVTTIVGLAFFALLLAAVLGVARRIGTPALGAGLLPVAVGYLVAHYLVYLLVDGQRIIHAVNDPLQRGDNLLGLDIAFEEPTLVVPTAVVWTIQLAAVVGGHVVGAWAGHAALERDRPRPSPMLQVPLAALMILLTSVTLWSLGQTVIAEPETATSPPSVATSTRG